MYSISAPNQVIAEPLMTEEKNPTPVLIWIPNDKDVTRITTVLEALGYSVELSHDLAQSSTAERKAAALARLSQRHKLTSRESEILALVVLGQRPNEIAESLGISRHTVKWHMHNLCAKTCAGTREALLRLVTDEAFKGV